MNQRENKKDEQIKVLAILAHPDDESFGMGGTLAKYSASGAKVVLLCATRGEAGIPDKSRNEAGKIREQELRQAAKHLGIDVFFLDFQDGELSTTDQLILIEQIGCWIDLIEPSIIITFGPDGITGHPDHIMISNIVTELYDRYFKRGVLLYLYPSESTQMFCDSRDLEEEKDIELISIDISEYKAEKLSAIKSHRSQLQSETSDAIQTIEKLPCQEVFEIARKDDLFFNQPVWFE